MTLAIILGAQVSFTFGPLILSSFGFDKYRTTLSTFHSALFSALSSWLLRG
jgi:hypothetical protein